MSAKGEVEFIGLVERSGELSRIRISREFCIAPEGLNNLSHIIMLYWFHVRDNEEERHTLKVACMPTNKKRAGKIR
jgi:tRNA (Thr-GGU) A37 N-methylase